MVCNDAPVNPARDYWVQLGDEYAVEYPLNGGSITGQPCLFWGGANVDKPSIEAVARAGTLLMVQSEYDALTITEGALEMFDRLPTARLVFVDDEYSHGIFPYGTECVDSAVAGYFIEGEVPPRRTDCGDPVQEPRVGRCLDDVRGLIIPGVASICGPTELRSSRANHPADCPAVERDGPCTVADVGDSHPRPAEIIRTNELLLTARLQSPGARSKGLGTGFSRVFPAAPAHGRCRDWLPLGTPAG